MEVNKVQECSLQMKFVAYDEYCSECVYKDEPEDIRECFECLSEPVRENSRKPLNFKEK